NLECPLVIGRSVGQKLTRSAAFFDVTAATTWQIHATMLEIFITFVHWSHRPRDYYKRCFWASNRCDRIGTVQLLTQRGFHSLFCVCGQGGIRDVADFFRKLTRDLANVF